MIILKAISFNGGAFRESLKFVYEEQGDSKALLVFEKSLVLIDS
jgi:hypothetical protein